ncbi:Zn-dependent protease [Halanaerobium saccharolyticum]|uniref:Zinc metalloprotease n=1 Tax=Halanaerobium saccharolyticum TaxID=43595 RepID=A0A4R7Z5G7_9FIRM|nr:site-2 protease family protein [Halanaerobium saccharolyticum]RAK09418.1 Zn-dependent protease [Halanaerobium saccharolyticum]TDW06275.1 Zn-dependent protease [Halanaerobium saccharolyticum]TDX61069.1 Zn-dependent protease [Halanaerobium saccharolyticum]
MKSSFTVGHLFGIPVKIHVSLLIILPFFAWAFGSNIIYLTENTDIARRQLLLNPYLLGFIMAVILFISILLHELAHSLVARTKDVETTDITLMLFGGLANIEEISKDPKDEMKIAASGPLTSLAIGVISYFVGTFAPNFILEDLRLVIVYTGQLNIFLAIFNLLPAFPSDGGRILRALIAQRTSFRRATEIASRVGKVFAWVFGIFGFISGNFLLVFIAFFIYIGASQEHQFSNIKSALSNLKVKDLMTREVKTVPANMSVHRLIEKMFNDKHSGFPVFRDDKVVGIVTMEDAQKIPQDEYSNTPVQAIMNQEIHSVKADDELYEAFKLLFQKDIGRLLVMEDNELKGIITRSDVMTGIRVRELENINGAEAE